MSVEEAVIRVEDVTKVYQGRGMLAKRTANAVRAVDGVSLELVPGRVLGLIGESGSGKSTLGELVAALLDPTEGRILYHSGPIAALRGKALKAYRKDVQVVFQDPYATLNPRYRVEQTLTEPLIVHGVRDAQERERRVRRALEQAGLAPAADYMHRWPSELSGGQRQRVALARALVLEPRVLVADEPVSMLDVSVRGAILTLIRRLAVELDLAVLFISHDLSTVRFACDDLAIMYLGRIVESGPVDEVMDHATHPYTRALLHAVPEVGDELSESELELPVGDAESVVGLDRMACRYVNRCPFAQADCRNGEPALEEASAGHLSRCIHPRLVPVWPDMRTAIPAETTSRKERR